ncbi:C-C motif chemokine 25b [Electrophorus electricus]|uniref:Chemokine interleukin-8-like domain-containing protein n=1 Tax=Electrophorus electricus TaxID=8005 RepID=A0A4W4FYI2_ELEEL|nr:C-C motif chemokine 25b [Electrophorus electricus]
MKIHALFLILLLACLYPSLAQGTYENCCLSYVKKLKKSIQRRTKSYRIQEMDGGCNISAIVFRLRKSRTFCGDPKQQWVKDLMKNIRHETVSY